MSAMRPELPREFVASHKRRRMMDAIAELTAESGYEATKIADIVRRAAVARKTLYDNFDGKEDLFLVLMEREIDEHAREIAAAVNVRHSITDRATGGAQQWMTMIEREPELLLLFMEFWAYGVRDAEVRPKVAARFAQVRRLLTKLIEDGVREFDLQLALPAEQLAVAVDALADGTGDAAHVGLTNVDHRLRAAFGNDYGLVVETAIGAGTKVVMRVPKFRSGVRASGGVG